MVTCSVQSWSNQSRTNVSYYKIPGKEKGDARDALIVVSDYPKLFIFVLFTLRKITLMKVKK